MSERRGVLAGGNWIVDHVKVIDKFPEQDSLANITAELLCNGGSPYNVLVNLSKLGATFPLHGVGLVGEDEGADLIRSVCNEHRIDISGLKGTPLAPTSYTIVASVSTTGRRTFFHRRGANALLDSTHFDLHASNAKIFHLGYLLLLEKLDRICDGESPAGGLLKQAQDLGMVTSIDVVSEDSDRFRSVISPALRYCDICFMNEIEAERTTGTPLRLEGKLLWSHLHRAAQILREMGVRQWVVIHFPEGAIALGARGAPLVQPAVRVPKKDIKAVVGAGDAFAAGVLLGFHEGKPMRRCLEIGAAAAATCICHPTTSGGLLTLKECLEFARRHGHGEVPELAV